MIVWQLTNCSHIFGRLTWIQQLQWLRLVEEITRSQQRGGGWHTRFYRVEGFIVFEAELVH